MACDNFLSEPAGELVRLRSNAGSPRPGLAGRAATACPEAMRRRSTTEDEGLSLGFIPFNAEAAQAERAGLR